MADPHYKLPRVLPDSQFSSSDNPYAGVKLGVIRSVDHVNMKCSVQVITGGQVPRHEVDLTQAMMGPRSFWGGIPEEGALVILAYRRKGRKSHDVMILGYVPVGIRTGMRFDPHGANNPADIPAEEVEDYNKIFSKPLRYKRLMLRPGEVGGMSSAGAELVLSRDITLCNRAGDMFELRDAERTLVSQAVHRVESDAAAYLYSGPVKRGAFFLPPEVFGPDGKTLKTENDRYFGRTVLESLGPGGEVGGNLRFANTGGKVLDKFNNADEFPPVTFANGRRAHYVAVMPDSLEGEDGAKYAFTERRLELKHITDLVPDVLGEIDGFCSDTPRKYIEHVLGTVVGNDVSTSDGLRQYGKILKPCLFRTGEAEARPKFMLEEVDRGPYDSDLEANTMAGAYMLRIEPPRSARETAFAAVVSKQGKIFLNVPGSEKENYDKTNVSAELNLEGGVIAHIGARSPDNVALDLFLDGSVRLNIGKASSEGQAFEPIYHCSVRETFTGVPDDEGFTRFSEVKGNNGLACDGDCQEVIGGTKETVVNGNHLTKADKVSVNAFGGHTLNCGEHNLLVSGKSQHNYALVVNETIVAGGKLSTILAGGRVSTLAAGASADNVLGGAMTTNCAAGAYTVSVGAGAVTVSTGAGAMALSTAAGALSLAAGAGAVAATAGLAMTLTAGVAASILAPQVLVGGPAGVLGVSRGLPMMPPGAVSLCWITGMPLMGSALFRSF